MKVKLIIIVVLILFSTTACGLLAKRERFQSLPDGFAMERLVDGYPLVLAEARRWSPQVYLESVYGTYHRINGQWRLVKAYYIFVDAERTEYIGLTIDLDHHRLRVDPPGRIGGKGGIVTTTRFDLEKNPIDEHKALSRAESSLRLDTKTCSPDEVIVSGHGDVRQVWWVDFKNPRSTVPLFLATLFVDVVTGEVRVRQDMTETICGP